MITEAVEKMLASLGELGDDRMVLASQCRMLAAQFDSGEIPGYATPAAHRTLRELTAALLGDRRVVAGLSDTEFDRLISGSW